MRLEILSCDLRPILAAMGGEASVSPSAFTRGLARNGPPPGTCGARFVLREAPIPALGLLAEFDPTADAWVDAFRGFLREAPARLRRHTYADVEDNVERLGGRLRALLGDEAISEAAFMGIPRGGTIVVGMLGYVLGLRADQFTDPTTKTGPLVIVDDCAYTGARLGEHLSSVRSDDVVFACLLAPEPVLDAIVSREPRVRACLSAGVLPDLTAASVHDGWETAWRSRLTDYSRYWIGVTEHVCFPWAEPDWSYWNEESGQVEDGWPLLPPELCLEHRPESSSPLPISVQQTGPGPVCAGSDVLFGSAGEAVAVTHLESGRRFLLQGVAADMWTQLVELGDIEPAAAALMQRYDVAAHVILADLSEFAEELESLGLMHRSASVAR